MAKTRATRSGPVGGMSFLLAFFGFFVILSVAALVRLQGNPIFLFTLALCLASIITIWRLDREGPARSTERAPGAGRRAPGRPSRRRR